MDDTEGIHAYGSRLLKNMGWNEAKGLGKNEDGMREPLKVKKKFNTKGIGFNGVDDKWIEHQETYEDILSELNGGNKPEEGNQKLTSIEERSRSIGGRVHYSKFLRGKDLSQKKEEDLKAIVINRKKAKTCSDEDGRNGVGQERVNDNSDDTMHPFTHTSNMSYQEYFAQRMKQKKEATTDTPGSSEVENIECARSASKKKKAKGQYDSGAGMASGKKERKEDSKRETASDVRLLGEGENGAEAEEGSTAGKHNRQCKWTYKESGMGNGGSEICNVAGMKDVGADDSIPKAECRAKKAKTKDNGSEESTAFVQGNGDDKSLAETEQTSKGTDLTKRKKISPKKVSLGTAENEMVLQAEDSKQEEVESSDKKPKKQKRECADNVGLVGEGGENPTSTADGVTETKEGAVPTRKKCKSQKGIRKDAAENEMVLKAEGNVQEKEKMSDKKLKKRKSGNVDSLESQEGTRPDTAGNKVPKQAADNILEKDESPVKKGKKRKGDHEEQTSSKAEKIERKNIKKMKADTVGDEVHQQDDNIARDFTQKEERDNANMLAVERPAAAPSSDCASHMVVSEVPLKEDNKAASCVEKTDDITASPKKESKKNIEMSEVVKGCTSKSDKETVVCKGTFASKKKIKAGVSVKRKSMKSKMSLEDNPTAAEVLQKMYQLQLELQNVLQQLTGVTKNEGKPDAVKTQKKGIKKKKVAGTTAVTKKATTKVEKEAISSKQKSPEKKKRALDSVKTQPKITKKKKVAGTTAAAKKASTKLEQDAGLGKGEVEEQNAELKKKSPEKKKRALDSMKTQPKITKKKKVAGTTAVAKKASTKLGKDTGLGKREVEKQKAKVKQTTHEKKKRALNAVKTIQKIKKKKVVDAKAVMKKATPEVSQRSRSSTKATSVQVKQQNAEVECRTHAEKSCYNNYEPTEAVHFTPMFEDEAYKFAKQVVYANNVKQERFKMPVIEYLRCFKNNLMSVYSSTNIQHIPGYATEQWMKQCTARAARTLRNEIDSKKKIQLDS